MDHKSTARQGVYTMLNNQFRIYSLITGIRTVTINEVGFQKSPVFRRVSVGYLPGQIEEFQTEILPYWAKKILDRARDVADGKGSEVFPANPASCKFCDFRVLCETTKNTRDWKASQLFRVSENFDVFGEE
jgi:hypothetical protein